MRSDPPEELLRQLRQAGEAVLFCHVGPDGDTLGSARALELLLNVLGWRTAMVVDGEVPARLRFLPGLVLHRPEEWVMPENAAAIAVDVSSPDRLGKAEALYNAAARRWVIDHHGTNPGFGHINWVEGSAPATAILVNRLYRAMNAPLTKEAAVCLYTALSTDTGNFVYDSVNDECFEMMAGLMEAGLPLAEVSRVLFREKREDFVRLLGVTLPSLRVTEGGSIAGGPKIRSWRTSGTMKIKERKQKKKGETPHFFKRALQFSVHDGDDQAAVGEGLGQHALIGQRTEVFEGDDALHQGQHGEADVAQQHAHQKAERAARQPVQMLEHREAEHGPHQIDEDMHHDKADKEAQKEAQHVDGHAQNGLVHVVAHVGGQIAHGAEYLR